MNMMMICLCVLWIVFLIILFCIWSIKSHCTNSYCEIQLSLYFLEIEAVSLLDSMIIVTLILSFVFDFMLYSICLIFPVTLIAHQPISLIVLCFSYRSYIYQYSSVMIVWSVQNNLDFILVQFCSDCLILLTAFMLYQPVTLIVV